MVGGVLGFGGFGGSDKSSGAEKESDRRNELFHGHDLWASIAESRRFDQSAFYAMKAREESGISVCSMSAGSVFIVYMSTVAEIENALAKLSIEEMEKVRNWLDDLIEDQLELSDEYKAKVQRAKQEIASGIYSRTRQPKGS
jgi:hypothetical protein